MISLLRTLDRIRIQNLFHSLEVTQMLPSRVENTLLLPLEDPRGQAISRTTPIHYHLRSLQLLLLERLQECYPTFSHHTADQMPLL